MKRYSPWPHRLAVVTASATLILIFVGGVVTNTGSALAVPDWPTTFGYNMFLYPWSRMVGGIFYEHSHRLIGSVVGMLTVACAVWLWVTEDRQWMRVLGLVAVVAVSIQGILGGLRVLLLEHGLAIIHGCVAQAFFALMVSMAVCTSAWWRAAPRAALAETTGLRALALSTAFLLYVQVVCGALLTHMGRLDAHLLCAGLVVITVCALSTRVLLHRSAPVAMRRPAMVLVALLGVQLSLGFGAYLWRFTQLSQLMPVGLGLTLQTTHRMVGAALLGTSVVLALRILRLSSAAQTSTEQARPRQDALDLSGGRQVLA